MNTFRDKILHFQGGPPVSYTHLDVYKRQMLYDDKNMQLIRQGEALVNLFEKYGITTFQIKRKIEKPSLLTLYPTSTKVTLSFRFLLQGTARRHGK